MTRRSVVFGLAAAALLPGCVSGPPVRPQRVQRGRHPSSPGILAEIDRVAEVFRASLMAAFRVDDDQALAAHIDALPPSDQSVAWEAAAMAVTFLERRTSAPRTWRSLFERVGPRHATSVALGLGWGLSWLGLPIDDALKDLSPLLRWRVADGYGFRDGMVSSRRYVLRAKPPARIEGFGAEVWLQGLARSLWYTRRSDVDELSAVVAGFPAASHPPMWRGLGIAATWIGSFEEEPMQRLREAAGQHRDWLAVGSALAARTRGQAGDDTSRLVAPCAVLGGGSPAALADAASEAEAGLPPFSGTRPLYGLWLEAIRARLAG